MENQSHVEGTRELFQLAVHGDQASLDQLLASYAGYLNVLTRAQLDRRILRRVSPSDIVQETLFEAHRDFAHFHGEGIEQFTGWLRKVLVHNISNSVAAHLLAAKRSVSREQYVEELSASVDQSHRGLAALAVAPQRSPASEVEHQESLSALASALEQLPADYRTVIVLRHLDGLAFSEVAERMQRTTGATRMLWLRAIEQLRLTMEKQT